jgi:AcrR family transcriptional regulator
MAAMASTSAAQHSGRGRNVRGQGERLREEIVYSALRLLEELGDDQALSLRAVARDIGIAATSVYIHFADRDALVLAAMRRGFQDLLDAIETAEAASDDPAAKLRARIVLLGAWAQEHPGMYKVLHESTVNQRTDTPVKEEMSIRTTAAIQRCMDAGLAPRGDAAVCSLDLRTAVHGAVSMRLNHPQQEWPPLDEQVDRFLTKLVGIPPANR